MSEEEQVCYNEDGTVYDPPRTDLLKRWRERYPSVPMAQYSQVCDGYSCMWCGRCPDGSYWKVPDEDKAEYDAYHAAFEAYMKEHNPKEGYGHIMSQIFIEVNL